MIRVITVDDHPVVRRGLKQIIAAEQDMQVVGEAENAREALRVKVNSIFDYSTSSLPSPTKRWMWRGGSSRSTKPG